MLMNIIISEINIIKVTYDARVGQGPAPPLLKLNITLLVTGNA